MVFNALFLNCFDLVRKPTQKELFKTIVYYPCFSLNCFDFSGRDFSENLLHGFDCLDDFDYLVLF